MTQEPTNNFVPKNKINTFELYLIEVGMRLTDGYPYTKEDIASHISHFKDCCNRGISPYKSLEFFYDYLKGKY